ncbi:hypothetical protein [Anabaena azotica]|uniref:Uncharacterized protein n=1 Tax=Anabaena azotica FACHB-119 TaxID=947527 RepID=A0ABR8DEA7_9NOST|nr:hypothetical protein [Anabaena azotica]MBD2505338.1 hypothetical protein [Anabaena azotica FACHB-119]
MLKNILARLQEHYTTELPSHINPGVAAAFTVNWITLPVEAQKLAIFMTNWSPGEIINWGEIEDTAQREGIGSILCCNQILVEAKILYEPYPGKVLLPAVVYDLIKLKSVKHI